MNKLHKIRSAERLTVNDVFLSRDVTAQFWQRLRVTAQPRQRPQTCHAEERCILYCPLFEEQLPNITTGDIFWKEVQMPADVYN